MEQYVGFDVSLKETWICVIDGSGKVAWQGKCATCPEAIERVMRGRARKAARIGLEAIDLALSRVARP